MTVCDGALETIGREVILEVHMNIGILGSGIVGQVLGKRLIELDHTVMLGTRDAAKLDEKKNQTGTLREWLAGVNGKGLVGTFAETAQQGDVLINATNGAASLDALRLAGEEHLNGKVLLDISNPLDFSKGMPPTLWVKDTDSLGEQIQRAFPQVKVVKTLNTMNCYLMAYPQRLAGGDHTVFMSGNDAEAKQQVAELLTSFGWKDIFDLGDINTARGAEMVLPIWLRVAMQLGFGTPFNFKVVR